MNMIDSNPAEQIPNPDSAPNTMSQMEGRLVSGLFNVAFFAAGPVAGGTLGYPIGKVLEKYDIMSPLIPTLVGSAIGLGLGVRAYFKNQK